jgi:hypothetical protein
MCVTTSSIKVALQGAKLDETLGELFLSNIFDQTPGQQNFIGVSLSRTDDLEGSADASFLVNKVDQDYADVVFASAIPLFPGNKGRCSRTCLVPDMLVCKSIECVGGGRSESATPHQRPTVSLQHFAEHKARTVFSVFLGVF